MKLGLGALLQACRIKSGMSQEDLAAQMNRSQTCISKYENNRKPPDIFTFMEWFKQTNTQEIGMLLSQQMINGIDINTIVQSLMPIVGGFGWWFFL
ncbi:helix-turn-helix transcriptional regulator [Lysinibacillus capsici]|uniref:helix-turn-helix domain-containing protein n=1 Tax=Lysinibacillus capsici TaxID=2115968 RepID=UPI002E23A184|nr:helix-turn-helix transcriptional regulator [Lysinibacillus capsici]MED4699646.1 helix-turn-helix transcriptional regulator [Lysinibacillus capsici]